MTPAKFDNIKLEDSSKMKKFITTIPLQVRGQLREVIYNASDNERLYYNEECSFPILCAINGYVEPGEKIGIVTVNIDNNKHENVTADNYALFLRQLDKLAQSKGFSYEIIRNVKKPEDDLRDTLVKTFSELIKCVDDGDRLFACVTYGTKPISTLTVMALHYAYKIKNDIDVCAVVYGGQRFSSETNNTVAEIYDVTSLFYIDESIESLARLNIDNPEKTLNSLMGIGE